MGTISSKKLVVSDLVTSLNFYQEVMQFEVVFQDLEKKTAMVQSPSKQTVLLVGDDSQNVSQWLTTAYDAPKPGKSLYFAGGDQLFVSKSK